MTQRSALAQILGLAAWLALAFGAAAVGAIASIEATDFYSQLDRPAWAPPGYVFGPVWSVLYTLMGIASWLVWREQGNRAVAVALSLYVAQLCVNSLWSWLFFAWRNGAGAFGEVLLLLLLILATMLSFWRVSRLASLLMIPYLAWVGFASALTWSIWQRNPNLL